MILYSDYPESSLYMIFLNNININLLKSNLHLAEQIFRIKKHIKHIRITENDIKCLIFKTTLKIKIN